MHHWNNPAEVMALLQGKWSISRTISTGGSFKGLAVFAPDNELLRYREDGCLQMQNGSPCFQSWRTYVYERRERGFAVYFDETPLRLFQEVALSPSDLTGHAEHHCGQDIYKSVYTFMPDGTFSITHDVKGPRKNYRMHSVFTRSMG